MDRFVDSSLIRFCTFSTPMELPVMDGWAGCASGGENGHRKAHNHPGGGGPDKCRSVHSDSSPHRCFQLMRLFYAGMPFGDRRVFYPDVSVL